MKRENKILLAFYGKLGSPLLWPCKRNSCALGWQLLLHPHLPLSHLLESCHHIPETGLLQQELLYNTKITLGTTAQFSSVVGEMGPQRMVLPSSMKGWLQHAI